MGERKDDLRGVSDGSQPIVTVKPETIFGRSNGITFIAILSNLEFQLCVPKEDPSPLQKKNKTLT